MASSFPPMIASVLYADDRLVAIAKPAGVSLATSRRDPRGAVERIVSRIPSSERVLHVLDPASLLLVHRLDVGTSGVVVLARDADSHRDLVSAFSRRMVTKTYLALVWGRPRPSSGEWSASLGPDRRDRRRMRVISDGRSALTAYRVVGRARHVSLLELEPKTGRTHQIRVHLAHAGHPIIGDDLYGGPRHRGLREPLLRRALAASRPLLHARRLHLTATPSTPELIVTAPLPDDFVAVLDVAGIVPSLA